MNRSALLTSALLLATAGSCLRAGAQASAPGQADAPGQWLAGLIRAGKADPGHGRYRFTFIMATNHLAADPAHGEAMRRVVVGWLNDRLCAGDEVQVGAGEHKVWMLGDPVTLAPGVETRQSLFSSLPMSPEAGSRGGKSIEHLLALSAGPPTQSKPSPPERPIIVVLSNGWSQSVTGKLDPGPDLLRIQQAGYRPITRDLFRVNVKGRDLEVDAAAIVPNALKSIGGSAEPRSPLAGSGGWVPAGYGPVVVGKPGGNQPGQGGGGSGRGPNPLLVAVVTAVIVVAIGATALALGRARSQSPAAAQPVDIQPIRQKLDEIQAKLQAGSAGNGQIDAETLKRLSTAGDQIGASVEDTRKVAKKLDLLVQDFSATMHPATAGGVSEEELGKLRAEALAAEKRLSAWTDVAVEFLDAAWIAHMSPDVNPDRRDAWSRAATSFARYARQVGLDLIYPQPGDPYLPTHHRITEVIGEAAGATVVAKCEAWGYRNGADVIRPADVVISSPGHVQGEEGAAPA